MHVTAIIAAGGRGHRFGGDRPKQLLAVGGRPILERSVEAFLGHPSVDAVVVALPQPLVDDPPSYLRDAAGVLPGGSRKPLRVVAGGERRQDSVTNAFRTVEVSSDIIVIHDAARPFVSADLITRTIAAAAESGAAVAALAAHDTVKRSTDAPGASRTVIETLPRETIFLAQTPQAFRRGVLAQALADAERDALDATDEATLVERAGHAVRIVDGEASNIKITVPADLPVAEAIARGAAPARTGRAGSGYDLHRLVAGRPLVLGGVVIPSDRGALGHSDADVVCHAVTDAILGGACLGDIGRHFPDSDPRWKDASSLDLLRRTAALAAEHGFEVGNVDVTIILERPKIGGHVDAMRAAVAGAIGLDVARVSIKGKTNEGMDAIGRGEAIAAHAVALLRSIGH
jgi:2-C-methyl-D-erythritol 4-phosphate cytidylyltransferase/2-C-methyl-D-erythritol 2,4-cyclodiphosphate synthase